MTPDRQSYDVFMILPDARSRFAAHRQHLRTLRLFTDGTALTGVDLYYRAETETALVGLHLDLARTTPDTLDEIIAAAHAAGAPVLQPDWLRAANNRRFYEAYLAAYETRVSDLPNTDSALRALARIVGIATTPPELLPQPAVRPSLEVRVRRGDGWALGRLWSLSADGIYVATSTPPRKGDIVEVELIVGDLHAVATIEVAQVTPPGAARAVGAAGFGGRFVGGGARLEVAGILAAGRVSPMAAPPPRRRDVRFPVALPVAVEHLGRQLVTTAIDVSKGGLFVRTPILPCMPEIGLELALPGESACVRARARVARTITEEQAAERHLSPGFGAELAPASDEDRRRFERWVEVVERRANRSIIVAAATRQRLADLMGELAAVGYAASGVTDMDTLFRRVDAVHAPDVVVIDESVAGARPPRNTTRRLASLSVPVVRARGESAAEVRAEVDRAASL